MKFIKNLFGLSLKSKVMSVIEKKIEAEEKEIAKEVKELKAERLNRVKEAIAVHDEEVSKANFDYNYGKVSCAERHVQNILAKII